MSTMTSGRLDEIRERAEAATEGPWRSHDFGHAGEEEPSSIVVHVGRFDHSDLLTYDTETAVAWMPRWERQESDNATFIAHARTDVPDLLAHVDHLTAENARLRERVDDAERRIHALQQEMAEGKARRNAEIDRLGRLLNPPTEEHEPCCRYCGEPGSDHPYPCC